MSQFLYRPYLNSRPLNDALVRITAEDVAGARVQFGKLWAARPAGIDHANLYNEGGKVIWDSYRAQ